MLWIIYNTIPCWYDGIDDDPHIGIIAVTGDYKIWGYRLSDCEWLIPGTWQEE